MEIPVFLLFSTMTCLMWSAAEAQQDGELETRGENVDQKVVAIEGVDRFRVVEPMFECVRVALSYLGEDYSPAYIQGISAAAFRISGICPCAPTVNVAMGPRDLIRMLGCTLAFLPLDGEDVKTDPEARLDEILDRIKREIRDGRPVLLWHAFTNAEWDVVCGFDEEKKELLGRGSYKGMEDYARADERRTLTSERISGLGAAILIGEKKGGFDARAAELAALREAVRHARSSKNVDKLDGGKWALLEGLACYDRWIRDFTDPERVRQSGDSYDLGIYRSTHRAASAFLREISSNYPAASGHLTRAAGHFAAEAGALDACWEVLGWESPKGPDAARNAQVVKTLSEARRHYDLGIGKIEQALATMGESRERPGSAGGEVLNRTAYKFEWIGPESPSLSTWDGVERRSGDTYADHVNPLYNIQEDLPHEPPEGDDCGRLWKELAGGLASGTDLFALVAYEGDNLAGMIRFLPKTLTQPRYGAWSPDDHRKEWTDDILWIGAACVDGQGAADGLDGELVRRVIAHARNAGYARIQCLGWSDVRPYAMWGQSFPATVYEKLGFRRIASVDGTHLNALPDMLAGRHSPEIQKAAKEAMAGKGFTEKEANAFHIVEHECKY